MHYPTMRVLTLLSAVLLAPQVASAQDRENPNEVKGELDEGSQRV